MNADIVKVFAALVGPLLSFLESNRYYKFPTVRPLLRALYTGGRKNSCFQPKLPYVWNGRR